MGRWVGGGCVVVGQEGGSVVGEWVGRLLARRGWRWPLRRARASARRCAEATRMRGAKLEQAHGAGPTIHAHIKQAQPSVGGWVVGGVRVVAVGLMGGGWVDVWAVGVLWLGTCVFLWLVVWWVGCWRGYALG